MEWTRQFLFFRRELEKLINDKEQLELICQVYERAQNQAQEERKQKQIAGINRAREAGKSLGRPKVKEPDNFPAILSAWEQKKINAVEAAKLCGIGISTFYRRVRDLRIKEHNERK